MNAIASRIKRLETHLIDATGLVPHSEQWFAYWEEILDRLIAGENLVYRGNLPLAVVDRLIERADREEGLTQ